MKKNIFNINEIITIVMAEIEAIESMELYGIDDEAEIPKPIENKLSSLEQYDYIEFLGKVEELSKEIYKLKSGELNELNKCHEEISIEAESILSEFIRKE